jgi:uncharacterized protein (DUF1810 family)
MMADSHNLERFVAAQDQGQTYAHAVAELLRGRKTSHWMWFVFPQIAGLGFSEMSRTYAIGSLAEARAYLRHSVLGPRLLECARIVVESHAGSAEQIFGSVDAVKLRSSMTLFLRAQADQPLFQPLFQQVLDRFFEGEPDPATDARLTPTPNESR